MTYDEWYELLKSSKDMTLEIYPSDLSGSLESALRRRARRDGFGLSIYTLEERGPMPRTCFASLFHKGTPAPGRQIYLKNSRRINKATSDRFRT